jgi:hypothetical protein
MRNNAGRAQSLHGALEILGVTIHDRNDGALATECARDGVTDSARATGDEDVLAM